MLVLLMACFMTAIVLTLMSARRQVAANRRRWMAAGKRMSLTFNPGTAGRLGELTGNWCGRDVTIRHVPDGNPSPGTEFTVGLKGLASRISLKTESLATGLVKTVGVTDPEVGDPEFDKRFYLQGSQEALLTALGADARAKLNRPGLPPVIEDGWMTLRVADLVTHPDQLQKFLRRATAVADSLDELPPDEALFRNATGDPVWEVRRRSVSELQHRHPGSPLTAQLGDALADDRHPRARVLGATLLRDGERAREVLRSVAFDANAPGEARLDGLLLLEDLGPEEDDADALWVVAQKGRLDALRACAVRTIAQLGRPLDVPRLIRASSMETPIVRVAACQAVTAIGGPDARELLVEGVTDPDPDVRLAAVQGLEQIGVLEDVELLVGPGSKRGDRAVAANAAMVANRKRAGVDRAEHGRLAVSDAEPDAEGRLSPEAGEPGALSAPGAAKTKA